MPRWRYKRLTVSRFVLCFGAALLVLVSLLALLYARPARGDDEDIKIVCSDGFCSMKEADWARVAHWASMCGWFDRAR